MKALTVSGNLNSIPKIVNYVKLASENAGLDRKSAYNLRLAIDEVTTNIITHGYQEAGIEGDLYLEAKIDERSLTILIEDTGMAYDPQKILQSEASTVHLPLEQRKEGGLGIYLALHSVDQFHYERIGDRNRNIFMMYR